MEIDKIKEQAEKEINKARDLVELEAIKKKYLSKRGEIASFFNSLKNLPVEERKEAGKLLNSVKNNLLDRISRKIEEINLPNPKKENSDDRVLLDSYQKELENGALHPLTIAQKEIVDIFCRLGFTVAQGPELEDEWHNFDALNIPESHPARDLWDTFWLKGNNKKNKFLLRTHTSPVQIRYMESHKPPLRIIVPGRVFRHEATDSSHEAQFYQLEGLFVGKDVSIANFKFIISRFLEEFFGKNVEIRLRPSFFPFTEPSFEIDLRRKNEKKWLEVMGAGMVHPNVFLSVGIDPKKWQGFAFGLGVDRFVIIKRGIKDIRQFYKGNINFIKQF